jgi:uncharacterized protein YndB with AHSA1/START domain
MEINTSGLAVASHEILIEAPAQRVWSLLIGFDRWTSWNPAVKKSRLDGAFEVGSSFTWKSGGITIISTLQEIQPETRLVWTGSAIGTRAIHVWSLQPTSTGVWLTTSESFDGWLVALMRKAMQKTLDQSLVAWLATIKVEAER